MLYLKKLNAEDMEKEWQFVRDMPEDENGLTNSFHGISREDFEHRAFPAMMNFMEGKNLPEGYVPETFLFLWKDDEIIGQFRIRHYLCESLRTGAGHIGYFIAKPFRGKGYGTEGLRLTLEEAYRIVPEKEIYLRVNLDNPASLHVMLNNGGRIVGQDEEHYFVRIPNLPDLFAQLVDLAFQVFDGRFVDVVHELFDCVDLFFFGFGLGFLGLGPFLLDAGLNGEETGDPAGGKGRGQELSDLNEDIVFHCVLLYIVGVIGTGNSTLL